MGQLLIKKNTDNCCDYNKKMVDECDEGDEEFEIEIDSTPKSKNIGLIIPEPTPIYISTKSKIAYLQDPVDLSVFWNIPVISYGTPSNGVIKKQIKFNSKTAEELNVIQEKLQKEIY